MFIFVLRDFYLLQGVFFSSDVSISEKEEKVSKPGGKMHGKVSKPRQIICTV